MGRARSGAIACRAARTAQGRAPKSTGHAQSARHIAIRHARHAETEYYGPLHRLWRHASHARLYAPHLLRHARVTRVVLTESCVHGRGLSNRDLTAAHACADTKLSQGPRRA